jgi:hypothetical protein
MTMDDCIYEIEEIHNLEVKFNVNKINHRKVMWLMNLIVDYFFYFL